MRVYLLKPDLVRYCTFALQGEVSSTFYWEFDGRSHAINWRTITMKAADEDDNEVELPDFALLGVLPVFSIRAVEVLLPFLRANGELLPVRHRRAEYMLYNVTRVSDALDEELSTLTYFEGTRKVMKIDRYVFKSSVVEGLEIFRIPQLLRGFVFVTEPIATLVASTGLTGFNLLPVWSTQ
jgi:hypothetical protein